ncbi:unnamed protein product [Prunus armeniaca]
MNNQQQKVPNIQQGQNGLSRATTVDLDHVLVEEVTEVARGSVLRPNKATSLEVQQLIWAMETSNQLNHQRMQETAQNIAHAVAQTMASQNAQMNERLDRLLGQQNGQNGNRVAPNGVLATEP